jgi:hypothetical protein
MSLDFIRLSRRIDGLEDKIVNTPRAAPEPVTPVSTTELEAKFSAALTALSDSFTAVINDLKREFAAALAQSESIAAAKLADLKARVEAFRPCECVHDDDN